MIFVFWIQRGPFNLQGFELETNPKKKKGKSEEVFIFFECFEEGNFKLVYYSLFLCNGVEPN